MLEGWHRNVDITFPMTSFDERKLTNKFGRANIIAKAIAIPTLHLSSFWKKSDVRTTSISDCELATTVPNISGTIRIKDIWKVEVETGACYFASA